MPEISITRALPSDAVYCHIYDNSFSGMDLTSLQKIYPTKYTKTGTSKQKYSNCSLDRGDEFIIIIIIMSCRQHGYPWPSLATSPYHSSPPAGLQGYILCPHIVAVCKFVLVILLLHIHMWGSIGVHRLWAHLWTNFLVYVFNILFKSWLAVMLYVFQLKMWLWIEQVFLIWYSFGNKPNLRIKGHEKLLVTETCCSVF